MLGGAPEGGRDPSCPGCRMGVLGPREPRRDGDGDGAGAKGDRAAPHLGAALLALFWCYPESWLASGHIFSSMLWYRILKQSIASPPASAVAANAVPAPDTARATGASHLCVHAPSARAFSPSWGAEHCTYHPHSLPTAAPRSRAAMALGLNAAGSPALGARQPPPEPW